MLATMLGMSAMMVGIMVGLPIIANMAILMLAIYGVIKWRSGRATYTLNNDGLTQVINPFIGSTPTLRHFKFEDIRSYSTGRDRKRDLEEYHFLKIKIKKPRMTILITDQKGDKEGFVAFQEAFEKFVDMGNQAKKGANKLSSRTASYSKSASVPEKPAEVKKRPSFYKRPFAKILTIFFVVMSVFLLYLWAMGKMNLRNLFRLLVIIIPGTIYMLSRVFFDRKKEMKS